MADGRDGRIITFYSYKGGTGRTMALANIAWILAANGQRVLVVDWDLEAPGLHRFFHPFLDPATIGVTTGVIDMITEYSWAALDSHRNDPGRRDWHLSYARILPHAVSLNWDFPHGGTLDFVSAGQQGREYSATVSNFDWDNFYDRLGGGLFFDALRQDMKRHYDYVLLDSRTGLSDIADICTVHLPDVLVDCFTLSDQSIDGAAVIARDIADRYGGRNIRILPVPMRIDEGEKEKADAGRALARMKFDGFPAGLAGEELVDYWGSVEIPYRPYYAYEETLATFGDETGITTSLLSAFERLTGVLSDGRVSSLPPIEEALRVHYRDAFGRRRPVVPSDISLSYVAEDRMWADWIEALLTGAGFRVLPQEAGRPGAGGGDGIPDTGPRTVVLLSPAYLRSARARRLWESVAADDSTRAGRQLLPVRVGDVRLTMPLTNWVPVDLLRLDEAHAAAALLRALDRSLPGEGTSAVGPRFPGSVPAIWNVPPRNRTFTGRSVILERLRDQMGGGMTVVLPQPQTLHGLGGVGKTQVALEYVHRFMADYDVVWWISAEQTEQVVAGLAELAVRLGARTGADVTAAARQATGMLTRGEPMSRWLLVFDNADDPEELRRHLPGGAGHILVTSRDRTWTRYGEALEVDVFRREESVEHLLRRAPGLTADEAEKVATAVGDLPLAVEQAAAWLAETATPVDRYLRQLTEGAARALSFNQPPDYPEPVAATWNVSIARLRERSPAAVRLLQLCAFFAPEPISMNLLYGKEMFDALMRYDPGLREKLLMGRVVREIGRFALAKVDHEGNSIQVHRLVQAVVRSQLTEEEQAEARHTVHRVLVGARPDDDEVADDPENWPRMATIWPHLGPSEALDCDEPTTRRLLIDRVRYLWKRGDFDSALALGQQLDEAWAEFGDDDPQSLYLRYNICNILRSCGRHDAARVLGEATAEHQRRVLGPDHPHTFMSTSGLAMDLGVLGDYSTALGLATDAYNGFAELFGHEHPRTLAAANNLALFLRLVGRYNQARELDQDVCDRRTGAYGAEHSHTLSSAVCLARDLREIGQYEESVLLLSTTYESYKRTLGVGFPGTLSAAKSLAVSLRRAGRVDDARRLTTNTRERYRAKYSAPNPETLACDLNLAADLYATGEAREARELAAEAVARHRELLGARHPDTLAAANNLVIYLWATGEPERARVLAVDTIGLLREGLGEEHPFTLAGTVNLANCHATAGELEKAEELERAAAAGLGAALGPGHPQTLACAANLSVTLEALGQTEKAHRLRAESVSDLARILGEGHAVTDAARQGRRLSQDLEPTGF